MKKKIKNILVALVVIIIAFSGLTGTKLTASASGEHPIPVIDYDRMGTDELVITPGDEKNIKIPVRAVGGYMNNVGVIVTPDKSAPFTISKIELSKNADYTPVLGISEAANTYIGFKIKVKDTAVMGYYPINITIKALDNTAQEYSTTLTVSAQVQKEKAPAQLMVSDLYIKDAVIGSDDALINFMVKNDGEITAHNVYVSLDYGKNNISPKYTTPKMKVGDLEPGKEQYLSFPVSILTTETVGVKTITANIVYKNADGVELKENRDIFVTVKKNDNIPDLSIDKVTYDKELKPGNKVNMYATISNNGYKNAENIKLKLDDASTGLSTDGVIKNFYTETIHVPDIKTDGSVKVRIPIIVAKQATGGLKKLNFTINYTDEAGTSYSTPAFIYPDIKAALKDAAKANIVVSKVNQSPSKPQAGGNVYISFQIQNKGSQDVSELKLALDGLTGTTFIPVQAKPYIYIESLPVGKKKLINIPLTVSDKIPEGLSNLTIKYTYVSEGAAGTDSFVIPVHDIQNDLGSKSKPKIIISKYKTDKEELRAGSTFNFTFDLKNTHPVTAAKNITVTVTQAEGVFTVTQGSNSFFINKIDPGDTVKETLEMKVKSDATTKTYPIKVLIEYDYDGAEPNPETGEVGVSKTEELSLQAVENSRPVIDNINVYSWDGRVSQGNPATLHFEFYNMGKSALNNVTAYVEGDFKKADGSMYFVGNVAPGAPAYAEYDIIPNIEGTAKGKLRVTFEDSNGDQKEITKDFEATVQPAGTAANANMGMDPGAVMNQNMPKVKKAIVPLWLFIVIQVVLFILFIPITKKVMISRYKAKKRKEEQQD